MKDLLDNPEESPLVDPAIEEFIKTHRKLGLSTHELAIQVTEMRNLSLFRCLNLKQATWHPSYPLSSLIKEIEQNGPLLVLGQFGQRFYKDPPFQLSQKIQAFVGGDVHERTLWGWLPGSRRNDELVRRHAVLIVGANAEKNHIYFIDPLDPSDPENPELQKIYVMSHERFLDSLCPLGQPQRRNRETGENIFLEPAPEGQPNQYAVHGDPTVNYL